MYFLLIKVVFFTDIERIIYTQQLAKEFNFY